MKGIPLTLIVIQLLLLFSACTSNSVSNSYDVIPISEVAPVVIEEHQWETIQKIVIPFDSEINPDAFLISKTELIENELFLLCETIRGKEVVKINTDGKVFGPIGGIGEGPGQYSEALDFAVDRNNILVLTKGSRVLSYDLMGNYLGFRNLPLDAVTSLSLYDNGNILYSNAGNPENPFRLWYLTPPDVIEKQFLSYDPEKNSIVFDGNRFMQLPWGNFFFEYLNEAVFECTSNGIDTTFLLDFGAYRYEQDIYNSEAISTLMDIRKRGFYNIIRYFEGPQRRLAYFQLDAEMPGEEPKIISFIYDKKNQQLFRFPESSPFDQGAVTVTEQGEWVFPTTTEISVNGILTEQLAFHFVRLNFK